MTYTCGFSGVTAERVAGGRGGEGTAAFAAGPAAEPADSVVGQSLICV